MNLNRFVKIFPCSYIFIVFSTQHVILETRIIWSIKKIICLYICRKLPVFPNNRIFPVKLKTDMLYDLNKTFRDIVFSTYVTVSLTRWIISCVLNLLCEPTESSQRFFTVPSRHNLLLFHCGIIQQILLQLIKCSPWKVELTNWKWTNKVTKEVDHAFAKES